MEAKVQELHNLPTTTDRARDSSTCHKNPEQAYENSRSYTGQTNISAANTSHESKKEAMVDKSTSSCRRNNRPYERSFSWSKDAKHLEVFTCNDCLVRIYTGDIMNVPVDCVVNATNEDGLKHCHGNVSAGGENVREGAKCWIQKNGKTLCFT